MVEAIQREEISEDSQSEEETKVVEAATTALGKGKKKKTRVAQRPTFKINCSDANHVGPLLTKLIAEEPSWQEVF